MSRNDREDIRDMPAAGSGDTGRPVRVVLLGASNLTKSLPLLVHLAQSAAGGPVEFLVADGYGRSYGIWSRFLRRELPGILDCGVWRRLEVPQPANSRTLALVADVGNDLAYDVPVDRLAGWVETCLERLSQAGAELLLMLPPLESLQSLSRWRYGLMRRLLFPGNRTPHQAMLQNAGRLCHAIVDLGERFQTRIVESPRNWYGFDPIHIRRRCRGTAWRTVLSQWFDARRLDESPHVPRGLRRRIRAARPALRHMHGKVQHTAQPSAECAGWRMFLY